MADKWYDVNGVFRIACKNGYVPLISPKGQEEVTGDAKEEESIQRNGENRGKGKGRKHVRFANQLVWRQAANKEIINHLFEKLHKGSLLSD